MEEERLALEILRGVFFPLIVAVVTSVLTILVVDQFKAGRQYHVLLKNLRRELQLAKLSHPVNHESAQLLTGAFVTYPVTTAQRLLLEPVTTKTLSPAFVESLQGYLLEALRINSLIENAKLLIGTGQDLGSRGIAGSTTKQLRNALVTESIIDALIERVLEHAASPSRSRGADISSSSNEPG